MVPKIKVLLAVLLNVFVLQIHAAINVNVTHYIDGNTVFNCPDSAMVTWNGSGGWKRAGQHFGTFGDLNALVGIDSVTLRSTLSDIYYPSENEEFYLISLVNGDSTQNTFPWIPDTSVYDSYEWTLNHSNTYTNMLEVTCWLNLTVGTAYTSSGDVGSWTYSGSQLYEDKDGVPYPESVGYSVSLEGVVVASGVLEFAYEGDRLEGGKIYTCNVDLEHYYTNNEGFPNDPLPPDPTNPPDPTDPAIPDPSVPGGNTDPEVAGNYDEFRKAVEAALHNRELSMIQIKGAVQQALDNQALSAEQLQVAFQNSLDDQGMDSVEIEKAVASGTARGNDLVESLLSQIRDKIPIASTNQYIGIGDNGETPSFVDSPFEGITNDIGSSAAETAIENMTGTIDSMKTTLSDRAPLFPQGITSVSGMSLTLGGSTVYMDWSTRPEFATIRAALDWMIKAMFFVGVIKIVRSGVA